jgi:hypothetical protein
MIMGLHLILQDYKTVLVDIEEVQRQLLPTIVYRRT